jgi:solute:Na+ symporter, SSS family
MALSLTDIIVMAVYLVGITAFGVYVGYRPNASTQQYFLAGKSLGWFTVGAAVFTSNISTLHLVGLAAGGARDGLVIGNFEWMACFTLILLALLFTPFYIRSNIQTLPEFMERRYGPQARTCLAIVGLLGALLIHIGISLFAAARLFESFLGIPMFPTIATLSLFTVVYTALGGLRAVMLTESVQVCLLIGGAILVTTLSIRALPSVGIGDLASFRAAVSPGQLSMLQPIHDAQGHLNGYSWLSVLLGYPILGIWYWCADQTHVQRVLGAKDLRSGQNGVLFAGFLKITPVFLMVLPGIVGQVLWQHGAFEIADIPGGGTPDYNRMLPALITFLIPEGLKGLLAASMAAALMSCMAAALNSCATLVSLDIVRRIRPDTSPKGLVLIGRISTGLIMILAMLWSTQGDQFGTIFEAINKIPMTFAPAITTMFLLGVLWKRGNRQGAMATFYVGTILGGIYFVLDLPSVGRALLHLAAGVPFAGLITDPLRGAGIPFMLVGPLLTALCIAIYVVVSLLTPPMEAARIAEVAWDRPLAFLKGRITGFGDPRMVSLYLMLVVGALYAALH